MTEALTRARNTAPIAPAAAWRIVALLTVANFLNFYDRTLPAVLAEELKAEFGLTDTAIGMIGASSIMIYAVAGIFLGRLADKRPRRLIIGFGLIVWSLMTAASGGVWSFASILIVRIGVGIGEASFAPAANSLLADLFPPSKRSRAVSIMQLGLPIGATAAFLTTGLLATAYGWRTVFLIAAVPGLIVGVMMLFIREPARGASDGIAGVPELTDRPFARVLRPRTMWWLIVCGIGIQISANGVATFLVPLLQRYFDLPLTLAGVFAGIPIGIIGVLALLVAGRVADRSRKRSPGRRLRTGAIWIGASAPLIAAAFLWTSAGVGWFLVLFSAGWFLQFAFHVTALPAIADFIEPKLRATAVAVLFAAFYILGGGLGPVLVGFLSETFAAQASTASDPAAEGLYTSLALVTPLALLLSAAAMWGASRTINRDHAAITELTSAARALS